MSMPAVRQWLLCCGLLAAMPAAFSEAPEPGDKWKITTSISMMGMNMPGQSSEMCASRKHEEGPPVPTQKNCTMSDVRMVGKKTSMTMTCTGDEPMTGTMEMEYLTPDHYRGAMNMHTKRGDMLMNYEGEKLPGTCDAGELKRKVAAMEKQGAAMEQQVKQQVAESCEKAARNADPNSYLGNPPACTDPKQRQQFCSSAQAYAGFKSLAYQEQVYGGAGGPETQYLARTAKSCGFNVVQVRERLCGGADAANELDFLADQCHAQAEVVARAHCGGRRVTGAPPSRYDSFCSRFASQQEADATGAAPQAPGPAAQRPGKPDDAPADKPAEEAKKSEVQKAKDKLKGLLHF